MCYKVVTWATVWGRDMADLRQCQLRLFRVPARAGLWLLLALAALTAHAQDGQVTLDIGGTPIIMPVEAGYARVSERSPELHSIGQAALPPSNRLVETFHTEPNMAAILRGENATGHYFMVQVMRSAEALQISDADWQAALPQIKVGLDSWRPESMTDDDASRAQRLSEAAGREISMRFGELEKPTIYTETADSVRFLMKIPVNLSVGSGDARTTSTFTGGAAGAIVLVKGKVLFLYWYAIPADPASVEIARQKLDGTIDRLLALNAPAAAAATVPVEPAAPAVGDGTAREGGSLTKVLIGGAVLLLVLVVGGLLVAGKRRS